ncbi:MAG: antitoxin [Planctomycetota bacterium]|jgi:plasmid stability protein
MATLQVKNMDDNLYKSLKSIAESEKRSLSQEVIYILQNYLTKPDTFKASATEQFLELSGSWNDERDAEEIAENLRAERLNSKRFAGDNELFD